MDKIVSQQCEVHFRGVLHVVEAHFFYTQKDYSKSSEKYRLYQKLIHRFDIKKLKLEEVFMAQKRYYTIVSVVAIFSMLFAMRKYYTTYAYSSVIFVVTGILGMLTVCLTAFGILALLNNKNQLFIMLGVVLATGISLLAWIFYWIDVGSLTHSISDIYWNGSLVDFDYMTTAISGIVESISICAFYFMGYKINDNQSTNKDCLFAFHSGLFICGLFLIASIERPLYYTSIAVIGGVLLTFLYFYRHEKIFFNMQLGF